MRVDEKVALYPRFRCMTCHIVTRSSQIHFLIIVAGSFPTDGARVCDPGDGWSVGTSEGREADVMVRLLLTRTAGLTTEGAPSARMS